MQELALNLKEKLERVVKRNKADGLLFSGGLDSSILAGLNSKIKAITVSLESEGEDIHYSKSLAKLLNMKHIFRKVEIDEAIESIPKVIKILKSFDPAIPNDLVVYFGLSLAKELGIDEVMTGDGADELFGGYSFMKDIGDLESYIRRISEKMNFSSNNIGKFSGIKTIQPFIDRDIIDFALQTPADLKIRKYKSKVWGKWILRKAFENALPEEIIWQDKRPLEYGSGMTRLRKIISTKISDKEFREAKRFYPVKFINKEHFYYYKIYRGLFGEIPKPKTGERECPGCGAAMKRAARHCCICGYCKRIT